MQKTALSSAVSDSPSKAAKRNHLRSVPAPSSSQSTADFTAPPVSLSVAALEIHAKDWLCDCQYRQLSQNTINSRRLVFDKLLWYLREFGHDHCDLTDLRHFLVYLTNSHASEEGRWGDTRRRKPIKPSYVRTWHGHIRSFFIWLVKEEVIETSPMDRIAPPINRRDQIQPFSEDQLRRLLAQARQSQHPRRDEAIILFLVDTGLRVSELCAIKRGDLNMDERSVTVVGKGNKRRTICFGRRAARVLAALLREQTHDPRGPVFIGDRGTRAGEALTRSGVLQLIERLGNAAKISGVRCSPHTFRHTFAISFLRNGGHVFALQQMLGHTSLDQTNVYVAVAQADIENQHRQFSPADRLKI